MEVYYNVLKYVTYSWNTHIKDTVIGQEIPKQKDTK